MLFSLPCILCEIEEKKKIIWKRLKTLKYFECEHARYKEKEQRSSERMFYVSRLFEFNKTFTIEISFKLMEVILFAIYEIHIKSTLCENEQTKELYLSVD